MGAITEKMNKQIMISIFDKHRKVSRYSHLSKKKKNPTEDFLLRRKCYFQVVWINLVDWYVYIATKRMWQMISFSVEDNWVEYNVFHLSDRSLYEGKSQVCLTIDL